MATRSPKPTRSSKPSKTRKAKAAAPKASPKEVNEAVEAIAEEAEAPAVEPVRKKVRLVRAKPKRKVRLVRRAEEEDSPTENVDGQDEALDEDFVQEEGVRRVARSVLDAVMPDLVKRIVAAGGEALSEESMRKLVEEAVLRKAGDEEGAEGLPEAKGLRGEFQRVLSGEIQKFLKSVDLSGELQKILTSLTFEVRTEIRFVPNEDQVRPKIKNRVSVKRSKDKA